MDCPSQLSYPTPAPRRGARQVPAVPRRKTPEAHPAPSRRTAFRAVPRLADRAGRIPDPLAAGAGKVAGPRLGSVAGFWTETVGAETPATFPADSVGSRRVASREASPARTPPLTRPAAPGATREVARSPLPRPAGSGRARAWHGSVPDPRDRKGGASRGCPGTVRTGTLRQSGPEEASTDRRPTWRRTGRGRGSPSRKSEAPGAGWRGCGKRRRRNRGVWKCRTAAHGGLASHPGRCRLVGQAFCEVGKTLDIPAGCVRPERLRRRN